MAKPAQGALSGVRVVDVTSVVLGPYATQMLGDMGADVIKVEPPEGDLMRAAEPARSPGMGALFLNLNRNKRSLALDLKQPLAREALLRVVGSADVFVHSMRARAIAKLGLGYDQLREVKPDLIYCSAWGFGSGGPYAGQPAYDDALQGMSGLADLVVKHGADAPELAPSILVDKTTGLMTAAAIMMALFHHARTGEGQEVEVPMLETMTSFNLVEHLAGAVFEPATEPMGYARVLAPHRKCHRTADGYIVLLPYTTRQWRSFFTTAGRTDMLDDPRVNDPAWRSRHVATLYAMISEIMPARTTSEWLSLLREADIPVAPVNSLEDLLHEPHLVATGFFETYDHPSEGRLRTTAVPARFSCTPGQALRRPPPRLGAHTREILVEAGLDANAIARLEETKAAVCSE